MAVVTYDFWLGVMGYDTQCKITAVKFFSMFQCMSGRSISFPDHCRMLQEVSDHSNDLVLYVSGSRVRNEQSAVLTEEVECELIKDRTLQAQFAIMTKVARIGEFSLLWCVMRGCWSWNWRWSRLAIGYRIGKVAFDSDCWFVLNF